MIWIPSTRQRIGNANSALVTNQMMQPYQRVLPGHREIIQKIAEKCVQLDAQTKQTGVLEHATCKEARHAHDKGFAQLTENRA